MIRREAAFSTEDGLDEGGDQRLGSAMNGAVVTDGPVIRIACPAIRPALLGQVRRDPRRLTSMLDIVTRSRTRIGW